MRLFKNHDPAAHAHTMDRSKSKSHHAKKAQAGRPPKEPLSASEIRSKVEEHFAPKPEVDTVEVSKFSKVKQAAPKHKQEVEAKPAKELSHPSDVGLNNPNDPATLGKLKSVLSKGAFSFNPKERDALEKILGERA